jgi:pimeloyl-ACP methyl ester carboxylesterase
MQVRSPRCVSHVFHALLIVAAANACAGAQNTATSWTFEQLLRAPTADELERVNREWAQKKWAVGSIQLAGTTTVPIGSERFEARLYTYSLNESQRCGAVILPPAAGERSLTGLVDIGDVTWDYRDRDLTNGPYVARILGDRARDVVLVVPCSRGMALRVGNARVSAEGDRRDAWEGVAEDAMAFLTVALSTTQAIDPKRLGVYGYSRGGGVALIVGERDPRITTAVAFAAPTDWFWAMGRPGENWPDRMEAARRDPGLEPDTRESQYLDWFVRDRETLPLADLRRRLVGASPLYFVERLPAFQIHQGEDDGPVPSRNATLVRDRLAPNDSQRVFTYPGAGHMLDNTPALGTAREFLIARLLGPRASK